MYANKVVAAFIPVAIKNLFYLRLDSVTTLSILCYLCAIIISCINFGAQVSTELLWPYNDKFIVVLSFEFVIN